MKSLLARVSFFRYFLLSLGSFLKNKMRKNSVFFYFTIASNWFCLVSFAFQLPYMTYDMFIEKHLVCDIDKMTTMELCDMVTTERRH